jgi:flagellar biosynthesis/type III secretory pathway protein FliH
MAKKQMTKTKNKKSAPQGTNQGQGEALTDMDLFRITIFDAKGKEDGKKEGIKEGKEEGKKEWSGVKISSYQGLKFAWI